MNIVEWRAYLDSRVRHFATIGDHTFNPAGLAPQFIPHFDYGDTRVIVERTYPSGEVYRRIGHIGITTGWSPCFLLMHNINSRGSSDCLSVDDRIVRVYPRRKR